MGLLGLINYLHRTRTRTVASLERKRGEGQEGREGKTFATGGWGGVVWVWVLVVGFCRHAGMLACCTETRLYNHTVM